MATAVEAGLTEAVREDAGMPRRDAAELEKQVATGMASETDGA